ncbi:DoxX family protein [Nocardioides zeae]|uniref:DoxX family protein n=1 Tax=Nocardioides imazamoxiresistens TaxID=3231893 RepID=A0ABU3PYY7_9ACTN|nr:DoxX family protein [Nocardioides zeae]MDT9594444.1 DoxX family protein [Nocardioides zeae]
MLRRLVLPAPPLLRDLALVAARIGLGVVLVAHGWQKVRTDGLEATGQGFDAMGVPAAGPAATFAAAVEIGGGLLLVLGLLTPVVAVLVASVMAGAFWFAHRGTTVLAAEGGWELVAVIGLGALLVGAVGAGRFSLDALLADRGRA